MDGLEFSAYADDLLIMICDLNDIPSVIEHCAEIFGKIGLQLNCEKCESTANGNEITFMNV